MKTAKKHLVYAEDLIYDIMQHPSRDLSKGLIHKCTNDFVKENTIGFWKHLWHCLTWWVK
jgi:hypothetical protein